MTGKPAPGRPANIRIESAAGESHSVRTASGTMYRKPGGWFLRYEDRDETPGITSHTVKITPGELKIIRRGAVESEMAFVPGSNLPGYFRNSQIELRFDVNCTKLRVDLRGGKGTVVWAYDLLMEGAELQHHRVTLFVF